MEAVDPHNVLALSRPLFWRPMSASQRELTEALSLARTKLSYMLNPSDILSNLKRPDGLSLALALFFSRIQLGISPMSPANVELVRSRMAFCRDISPDRNYLRVGFVSEPIISEAACWFWNQEQVVDSILDHMIAYTKLTNVYSKGAMGECVAMIILCMAWNRACDAKANALTGMSQQASQPDCYPFSRLISIKAFLDALLGCSSHGDLDSRLAQSLLYFTHFRKIHYTPSRRMLLDFFRRGAAIICKSGEHGIDLILPAITAAPREIMPSPDAT